MTTRTRPQRMPAPDVPTLYRSMLTWLDIRAFPVMVATVAFPLTILFDALLLPILLALQNNVVLVLLANSYLNVASATVSAIILRQSLKHHHENKQMHATHAADITALHAKVDALAPKPHSRKKVAPSEEQALS